MTIDTTQKKMSAMNLTMPWRGLCVAMSDADNLGETQDHVGTWQALDYMYGGTMAITYRPGVDAASSNLSLGTLCSDDTSAGTQMYFVSLDNLIGIGELANGTPAASSPNTALTVSDVAVTTAAMSTNDGSVVAPIGRAIEFRVTLDTSAFANATAPILVHWPTDGSNANNVTVTLNIVWNA